ERRVRVDAFRAFWFERGDRLRVLDQLQREVRRVERQGAVLEAERRWRWRRLTAALRWLGDRAKGRREPDHDGADNARESQATIRVRHGASVTKIRLVLSLSPNRATVAGWLTTFRTRSLSSLERRRRLTRCFGTCQMRGRWPTKATAPGAPSTSLGI